MSLRMSKKMTTNVIHRRFDELHAQDAADPARWWRHLPTRVRHDADVLSVSQQHADGNVRPQPQHIHKQRQLLLPPVAPQV